MSDKKETEYEVGYGRPPQKSRFRPGQSGNPVGRKKGATNFSTEFDRELGSMVTVSERGKQRRISKRRAIVKQSVNKAITGDPKHIVTVLAQERQQQLAKSGVAPISYDTDVDQRLIANLIERIREAGPRPLELTSDVTVAAHGEKTDAPDESANAETAVGSPLSEPEGGDA
jgi:hypothetical protein